MTITITLETTWTFTPNELWPDDQPSTITAETVNDLIHQEGGPHRILRSWNFPPLTTHIDIEPQERSE